MALVIASTLATLGTLIKCPECQHSINPNSEYEWVDSNQDTYFTGMSLGELAQFLITHALHETTTAFYMQSPVIAMCRCGHGFGDHSFYGETRVECHGETIDETPCDCGQFDQSR